jgi:cytochrome c oxidase assembly protein subunit 15
MSLAKTLPATRSADPPSPALRGYAWGVLALNVAVILWGAVVRATGSGAGCGDHWPLCNGVVFQHHPQIATVIELVHRLTSALTGPAVLGLLVWTFRAVKAGHLARACAVAVAVLTFNEALLGALLVLLGHTANDRSPSRAAYLSLHFANTMLLLAALALCAHFLSRERDFEARAVRLRNWPAALLGLGATLVAGVLGSLAALGDTLFPATSLRAAMAQDFSHGTYWLLRLRILHPIGALIAGVCIVWMLWRGPLRSGAAPENRASVLAVLLLLGLQYALGVADLTMLAPVWLQVAHLLGADLLWISLVVLAARTCVRG